MAGGGMAGGAAGAGAAGAGTGAGMGAAGAGTGASGMSPLFGLSAQLASQGAMPPMGSLMGSGGSTAGTTGFMGQANPGVPANAGFMTQGAGQGNAAQALGMAGQALDRSGQEQRQQFPGVVSPGGTGGQLNPSIMQLLMQMMRGQGAPNQPTLGSLISGR